MQVQYKLDGLFTNSGLLKYKSAFRDQIFKVTAQAMNKVGKSTNEKIQKQAQMALKIKRNAVLKSFKSKVYSKDKNNLPSLHYYSRIPWMGVHTKGATLGHAKKLIIPFSSKRIGYKQFKNLLAHLRESRNLFMKKAGATTVVFAKNTDKDKKILAPFRKSTRAYNNKIVRKNETVVIGIMVGNVRMSKKFDMEQTAVNSIPEVTKEVSKIFKTSKTI